MQTSIDIVRVGWVAIGVIATLLVRSVASIAIIIEPWTRFLRVRRQSAACALETARLLRMGQLREAQEVARRPQLRDSHLARLIVAGLREWDQDEGIDGNTRLETARTAVRHATAESLTDLRWGLVALGTIASTAPFVGLFGTTFGIINAFTSMSQGSAGNINTVSAGISEALITTAFGLFVAVPALWAYNALGGRVDRFSSEMDRAGDQLVLFLARRVR